jgi:predicted acylesterase/phospholipase RssA
MGDTFFRPSAAATFPWRQRFVMTQVGQLGSFTRRAADEIVNAPPVSEEREPAKLGLALSGGGHRAAFFHIGVLATLAELGLLRPVQVISTVSGGSIIGALYYLHVKNLLESKTDAEIVDADYVKLVRAVDEEYREAATSNVCGSG